MANLKVQYFDSQDWIDINSKVVNWGTAAETFKDERIYAHYIAPEIVTDIWNGLIHDVQHLRHNAQYIEFWGKESEIQSLSQMQSCDSVIITDIDNGLQHTVDMQTSEWFIFNEPERVADTTSWKISFIYRTNRTVINKFTPLSNQVALVGGSTYNSKYEKLNLPTVSEPINVPWFDGSQKLLREINKDGFKVLLYMNDSNMQTFKADYNQNTFTIDATAIIEKLPLEINQLGIDNYQIIVSVITDVELDEKDLSGLATEAVLVGSGTYNSKYVKINLPTVSEQINVEWFDGSQRLLKETNKDGFIVRLYLSDSAMQSFKADYNQNSFTIDAAIIIEKLPLEINELGADIFEIIVSVITNVDQDTKDLTPLNTHELVITDTGGPYTFHTDYSTESNVDDTEQDKFTQDGGLNVTAKTISREVTDIKLFLNTTDKNSLKLHYEKGTATIDTVAILEKGIAETTPLAFGLWEVNIKGLTTEPDPNYPL